MCFSAEASFISSAILTAGAAATLKQVKQRNELPLAMIPLIFAFHQFIEGCLWLTHDHASPPWLISLLAHAFPLIAYSVWPMLVPYAVYRVETRPARKKLLMICRIIGIGVSVFFLFHLLQGPVTAKFINQSIHYDFYFSPWVLSQWLYGFSIIAAALVSSHRIINLFGIGLVISYNVAKQLYLATYPSVFCFFAAILSLVIYLQIRYGTRRRQLQHDPSTAAPETERETVPSS